MEPLGPKARAGITALAYRPINPARDHHGWITSAVPLATNDFFYSQRSETKLSVQRMQIGSCG